MRKFYLPFLLASAIALAWVAPEQTKEHLEEFDSQYLIRSSHRDTSYGREVLVSFTEDFEDDDRCWDSQVIGLCESLTNRYVLVRFRESWWYSHSYYERQQLVMHELGHCVLGRDHDDRELRNEIPRSLMHSTLTMDDDEYNRATREWYLEELFEEAVQVQACFE